MKREDGFEQLVDGEPITMMSNEVFKYKCCDCGLVHNMVIATEEQQEIGFVVERHKEGMKSLRNKFLRELQNYTFKDSIHGNVLVQLDDVVKVAKMIIRSTDGNI